MNEYLYNSPIGTIRLLWEDNGGDAAITGLYFADDDDTCENINNKGRMQEQEPKNPEKNAKHPNTPPIIAQCATELDEYFTGSRKIFTVNTNNTGTPFQERCRRELLNIPYGETRSYQQIAEAAGNPKAVRAAGGANHTNKISIIYPCHRVIGKDGSLTGYGGGLWRKEWLLSHEWKYK